MATSEKKLKPTIIHSKKPAISASSELIINKGQKLKHANSNSMATSLLLLFNVINKVSDTSIIRTKKYPYRVTEFFSPRTGYTKSASTIPSLNAPENSSGLNNCVTDIDAQKPQHNLIKCGNSTIKEKKSFSVLTVRR